MKKYLIFILAFAVFAPAVHAQYYYNPGTYYTGGIYYTGGQYLPPVTTVTPYTTTPYATTPYATSPYATSPVGQFLIDLSVGSRGQDVSDMQTWLIAHGFDIPSVSSGATAKGYFGLQTKNALAAFQRAVGLPDNGIFGPATRAKMQQGYVPVTVTPSYPVVTYPGTTYPGTTCYTTCSALVINGIDSPSYLVAGQAGTWTIRATDSYNSFVTYTVDWGDNSPNDYKSVTFGNYSYANYMSTNFTHQYSYGGNYTIRVLAKDLSGYSTQTTATVFVQGQTGNNGAGPLQVISPNGGENWARGSLQTIRWTSPYYFQASNADVKLLRYNNCTTQICPMIAYAPYTIATNIPINQNSYTWNVGSVIPLFNGSSSYQTVDTGQYSIQICQTGTNICDTSDSTFNIY